MAHDVAEETRRRKEEHLRIPLERDVAARHNPWDDVHLRHEALPGFDLDGVDLATRFLDRDLRAPLLVTGMTGGAAKAEAINAALAEAAAAHGVAMGVGSQRAALEDPSLARTYAVVLEHDVPLRLANLGLPQILQWGPKTALERAEAAVAMIDAHALCIHLNYLQETVMPEGDTQAAGGLQAIADLADDLGVPVVAKETGAGIDGETAGRLVDAGVSAIDVGGQGGTSFSAVEHHRALDQGDAVKARLGRTFWDWGNPTPDCITSVREVAGDVPLIATGGLRHGLDATKALALGADVAGFAGTMFRAAAAGNAREEVGTLLEELKAGLFLSGVRRPSKVRQDPSG